MAAEVRPQLCYRDPAAALEFLAAAFGFETSLVVTDADGRVVHAQSRCDGQAILIAPEASERHRSPQSLGGANTQMVHIRFEADIARHCEAARAAGAIIRQELRREFYGDVTYIAEDPEGHLWIFGQEVSDGGGPPPEGWTVRFGSA